MPPTGGLRDPEKEKAVFERGLNGEENPAFLRSVFPVSLLNDMKTDFVKEYGYPKCVTRINMLTYS